MMWKAKPIVAALTIVLAITVVGCGKNKTKSAKRPAPTAPAIGDTAQYVTTSAVRLPGAASPAATTGYASYRIIPATDHGKRLPPFIRSTFEMRIDTRSGRGLLRKTVTSFIWLGLDRAGNTYLLGESLSGGRWELVTDPKPPLCVPANIKPGSSWSYVAHFDSGNTETRSEKCLGIEEIDTSTGRIKALKTSRHFSRILIGGMEMTSNGYSWYGPDTPYECELKNDYDATYQQGGVPVTVHIVETLQQYSKAR